MRLYVNTFAGKKYLNVTASTRAMLANIIGSNWFIVEGITYDVNSVYAEGNDNNTAAGAILGGVIGLLGGPIGVLGGGILGGLIGNGSDSEDYQKVNLFNNSRV